MVGEIIKYNFIFAKTNWYNTKLWQLFRDHDVIDLFFTIIYLNRKNLILTEE